MSEIRNYGFALLLEGGGARTLRSWQFGAHVREPLFRRFTLMLDSELRIEARLVSAGAAWWLRFGLGPFVLEIPLAPAVGTVPAC